MQQTDVRSDADRRLVVGNASRASGPTTIHTPIGLAIDIEDGVPVPLSVRANQTFYINQIDMRAHVDTTVDEGVDGLFTSGDFAPISTGRGTQVRRSGVRVSTRANADGTFTRRRFYREAQPG